MKKLLCLFLLITCVLVLASCVDMSILGFGNTCTAHVDNNGDLKCEICGVTVECTSHKDKDEDLKCDKCGIAVECKHKDADNDGECDVDACDYAFCEHEYEEEYSHNKTHHYYLATCDCNTDPKDKAPHEDENNDGICDVCEWNYNHTHTYEKTYTHNATHHWYAPTCEHDVTKGYAAHEDKANDGICDVCEWDYDHTHTYSDEWTIDNDKHWHEVTCSHFIDVKDEGNHIDANNDGICDVCKWDYNHTHTYAQGWTSDGTNHWHEPTCGHNIPVKDVAAHVNEKDALDREDGECDVCGANVCGPDHTFDPDAWGWDETGHWHPSICGHSTADMERKGHDYGEINDGICKECGYVSCEHPYLENVYDNDATHHWNKFTCTHTVVPADRKTSHEDCDENNDGVCDDCEYQFCQHPFNEEEWAYAEGGTTHWHPTVCTHNTPNNKKDEAEHVDLVGNDGLCDICGALTCQHPQSDNEYSNDTTHHWNKFTSCDHIVPDALKTLHTDCDENNDGICDVCKYQFCDHPQSQNEYDFDATHHWFKLTECDHVVPAERKTAHDDDDRDGVCTVCGVYCTHTFDTENWLSDGTKHWHVASCGHNVDPIDVADHVDTADNNGICDICGYVSCTHFWAETYSSNGTHHWYAPSCGHSIDPIGYAEHVDRVGNDGLCDACHYQLCNHTYVTVYTQDTIDENYHWYATICGHEVPQSAKQLHDDPDHDGFCTTCGFQFCTHPIIENQYDFNATHHWNKTQCGHPLSEDQRELHDDPDNDGVCTVCGVYCEHSAEDEKVLDKNDTHHWYKYTDCEHIDYSTKEEHVDIDFDNKCDVCEKDFFSNGNIVVDPDDAIETPSLPFVPQQ